MCVCWASSYRGVMSLTFCSLISMLRWWKTCMLEPPKVWDCFQNCIIIINTIIGQNWWLVYQTRLILYISASDQVKIPSSTSIGLKSALYSDVLFNPITALVEISATCEWCELPKMHLGKLTSLIGLNKTYEYNADFNPMDVLEGILTWSEAEMYRINLDVWLTVHRSSMWIKRPTRCHFGIMFISPL